MPPIRPTTMDTATWLGRLIWIHSHWVKRSPLRLWATRQPWTYTHCTYTHCTSLLRLLVQCLHVRWFLGVRRLFHVCPGRGWHPLLMVVQRLHLELVAMCGMLGANGRSDRSMDGSRDRRINGRSDGNRAGLRGYKREGVCSPGQGKGTNSTCHAS